MLKENFSTPAVVAYGLPKAALYGYDKQSFSGACGETCTTDQPNHSGHPVLMTWMFWDTTNSRCCLIGNGRKGYDGAVSGTLYATFSYPVAE